MTATIAAVAEPVPLRRHRNLRLVSRAFVVLCCAAAWLPLSLNLGGLNLRASQAVLPIVLMLLWAQRPFTRLSRHEILLLTAGVGWWTATLVWTILSGTTDLKAFGRVLLLGINMLHFAAVYVLIVRARQADDIGSTFLLSVAVLNAVILSVTSLATMGVPIPSSFLWNEDAPVAVDGAVMSETVKRFSVGVVVGCISAAAFVLALALLLEPRRKGKGLLLVSATLAGVGVLVGFSRQGIVSLVAGLVVVLILATLRRGHVARLFRAFGLTTALLPVIVGIVWVTPGGQEFFEAFAGRTLLLAQPESYTTGTVLGRTVMWLDMWADIKENPFVGRGQDAYRRYMDPSEEGSHNLPLEVLHTTGVWGFVPYLIFHLAIALGALRAIRRSYRANSSPLGLIGFLGAYVAVVLASATNLIFWGPGYWLVGGMLAGATSVANRQLTALETSDRD